MMETLIEQLLANPGVVLFSAITLIEIAPIKINPWKWLGAKIGNLLVGDVRKDLQDLKKEVEETKVQNWRWNVLDFANSCKNNRRHTQDEWKHTISQLAEYEEYIDRHEITNGVFEEDARYLREEYQKHCRLNDFL